MTDRLIDCCPVCGGAVNHENKYGDPRYRCKKGHGFDEPDERASSKGGRRATDDEIVEACRSIYEDGRPEMGVSKQEIGEVVDLRPKTVGERCRRLVEEGRLKVQNAFTGNGSIAHNYVPIEDCRSDETDDWPTPAHADD